MSSTRSKKGFHRPIMLRAGLQVAISLPRDEGITFVHDSHERRSDSGADTKAKFFTSIGGVHFFKGRKSSKSIPASSIAIFMALLSCTEAEYFFKDFFFFKICKQLTLLTSPLKDLHLTVTEPNLHWHLFLDARFPQVTTKQLLCATILFESPEMADKIFYNFEFASPSTSAT
jgi:hypothetical protein